MTGNRSTQKKLWRENINFNKSSSFDNNDKEYSRRNIEPEQALAVLIGLLELNTADISRTSLNILCSAHSSDYHFLRNYYC